MIWPTPSPLGFVDSSAFTVFFPSGGGDCASDLADSIIRAIVAKTRSTRLMA